MEPTPKVVCFDLDGTLFDHHHSMRLAISATQKKYTFLAGRNVEELVKQYNVALQKSHDDYLNKTTMYEEADIQKVYLFFAALDIHKPSLDEAKEFRAVYKASYRENRRETPGSIEALVRLREHGYRVAIVTNGQARDQTDKAKAIGILHLTDHIITSEEVGHAKPDARIFQYAIEQLGAPLHQAYMVGDSAESDIKGALSAKLAAIMYSPVLQTSQQLLSGHQARVVRHMSQLLGYFGITNRQFEPRFTSAPGQLVIKGIGIDLVTEPRHRLQISKETVRFLAETAGLVISAVAKKHHVPAMSRIEGMIRATARAAGLIDEKMIQISLPGRDMVRDDNRPARLPHHSSRPQHVRRVPAARS